MSWTNFLLILFGCYLFYYSANLLFDLFFSPRVRVQEELEDELYFPQVISAELVSVEEAVVAVEAANSVADVSAAGSLSSPAGSGVLSSGILNSSGGVGLKQLFSLAKDNLIEHTGAIPY